MTTEYNFLNISKVLFIKKVQKDLLQVKNVDDITNFIFKWKDYYIDEHDSNRILRKTYERVKKEKVQGIFITILVIDNKPHNIKFLIDENKAEYIGAKKVSEDFIKQFRKIAIPPPNIILNYMSKKAKFENN